MLAKWMKNTVKDFWKFNLPLYRKGDRLWGMRGAVGDYQEGRKTLFNQGLFEESSTAKERLGTKRELDDGRIFRYIGVTAAALIAGHCVSKAQTPVAATIAAADALLTLIGAREISLTIAGATADLYKDGRIVIATLVNVGANYKIRGNGATDGIGSGRAAINLYDKLFVALTAAGSTVWVHQSPYKDLLINPACALAGTGTAGERVMGVTVRAVTASYYAWVQTGGVGSMILDVDAAAGDQDYESGIIPGSTAGRGALSTAGAIAGTQIIAQVVVCTDLVDATANLVYLKIE